jgi:hypothetical protein
MKLISFDGNIFKAEDFIDATIEYTAPTWRTKASFCVTVKTENGVLESFNYTEDKSCRNIVDDILSQLSKA